MTAIVKPVFRTCACIALVAAIVAAPYPLQGLADRPYCVALLSLMAVLAVTLAWGTRYTVFFSFVAAIGMNFLVSPVGHLNSTKGAPWTALATCLIVGSTANWLSERARRAVLTARRSETELRDIVETIPATTFTALPDGSITFVNRQWTEFTGLSAEETAGAGWQRVIHPQDLARHTAKWQISAAAGEPFEDEARFRRAADGEYRWFLVRSVPFRGEQGKILRWYGKLTDIEDRKQTEEALRRSECYLAEAQRLSHTGSWAIKAGGGLFWSEENSRIWGFDPQQGPSDYDTVLQRIHPEDRDRVRESDLRVFRERSDFAHEFRIVLLDGTVRHINAVGHPVCSASGEVTEVVGTHVDVTERKRAEEERERLHQVEADLEYINRVTTMGELTASLAHEINQPIAAAVTNANTCVRWLAGEKPNMEEARQAAGRIVKDANRAAEIVSRIRLLFTKSSPERELVDMNEIISGMVALLRNEAARYGASIRTSLAGNVQAVMGDRVQLQQVLMNLMINGIDAIRDVDGDRELAVCSQQDDSGKLHVSVSDTGVGLPPELDRIFDAFFTTKSQGTGMGLAISRSIIESHGGRLWATSNSGRGAVFHFTLPTPIEAQL